MYLSNKYSIRASIQYYFLCTIASLIILAGLSFVYSCTGITNLA